MRAESTVHIARNNHQVGIVFLYDVYDARHCFGAERIAGRVAWVGASQDEFSLQVRGRPPR